MAVKALTNADIQAAPDADLKVLLSSTSGEQYKAVLAEYNARRARAAAAKDAEDMTAKKEAPEFEAEAFLAALRAVPVIVRGSRGNPARSTVETSLAKFLYIPGTLASFAVDRAIASGAVVQEGTRLSVGV